MNYGDTIKLLARHGDEARRFLFKRSAGATSSGYKLYGYDPGENARNLLEDFGIGENPTHHQEVAEAKRRIQFYVGEDWEITVAQTA